MSRNQQLLKQLSTIKILGQMNTGTNYLAILLSINLDLRVINETSPNVLRRLDRMTQGRDQLIDYYHDRTCSKNLGWKHRVVFPDSFAQQAAEQEVGLILLTKHPVSWFLSFQKRNYNYYLRSRNLTVEEFAQCRFTAPRRSGLELPVSPIELWNKAHSAYLSIGRSPNCKILRYEDLVADPVGFIAEISQRWNLRRSSKEFTNKTESSKNDANDFASYQDYYLQERWRDNLTEKEFEYLASLVDRSVASALDYSLEN